jgi:broad specificity phosphatase PhoE
VSGPALILVRHARPQIAPDVPPPRWRLSDEGRAAAEALAARIAAFRPGAAVASTEPKAMETAEILVRGLGLTVTGDPAFDEHRRPAWPFEADPAGMAARVERALTEPEASIDGAETAAAALRRFETGLTRRAQRPLLVVSHGTVLSLYLAARLGLDAAAFWSGLKAPEAFILDAEGRILDRIA